MKLSILVPIYNERIYLREVFSRICAVSFPRVISSVEIIAINDGSRDGTEEWLRELQNDFRERFGKKLSIPSSFHFLSHGENRGKGFAVRWGIDCSTGDLVVIQDADLEYNPADYLQLLEPLLSNQAEIVFSNRFSGAKRRILFFRHALFNKALNLLMNLCSNSGFTDIGSGYKAFKGNLLRSLNLSSERFGIEVELAARAAQTGARIFEVGISYQGRSYEEGKKIGWKDGIAAVFHTVKFVLLDRVPYKPGIKQTLNALDVASDLLYKAPLAEELERLHLGPEKTALEIGAGIGSITQLLVSKFKTVVASDIDPEMAVRLAERFHYVEGFSSVVWDASRRAGDPANPQEIRLGKFDLIVAFNVLEHLPDASLAIAEWKKLLTPEGKLLILVPFSKKLFTPVDRAIGHYTRYSKSELTQLFKEQGVQVSRMRYLNPLGILGWVINGKILKRDFLPEGQISLYRAMKPFVSPFERLLEKFVGLSILAVGSAGD